MTNTTTPPDSSLHRLVRMAASRDLSDHHALSDYFEAVRLLEAEDPVEAHKRNRSINALAARYARDPQIISTSAMASASAMYDLYNRTMLFEAPHSFDFFMRALERNRPPKEQFWLPRRTQLLPVCRALQQLEDGDLDELFLSQPPRTGKTTLMVMFILWTMGRDSERSNLYCSYTDSVVSVFYNGLLEILGDGATYAFKDIFPSSSIASTNAKDLLINLDRKKRYASFTGRSLYGTLNGACDCNGFLIADDLISGVEEAMSKDRLRAAWAKVDNNMLPRAKESARVLWIGTRWSLIDPQGIRMDVLQNEPKYVSRRWKALNTPALDTETDESNFDYAFGVGFSTEYYQQRRASFERNSDMASWQAQYMGVPIEREGTVFDPDSLRYFNGVLPEGDPDRVFLAVDPAYGGGDYTAGPVCAQYGEDIYVLDVIFDNGEKNVTQPKIERLITKYNVKAVKVEGTKMTAAYGNDIDAALKKIGVHVNMVINTSHFTGTGKQQRIFDKAPDIREHMVFLSEGHRTKEYTQFMQNLFSFTMNGKIKHDDAPDSLSMAIEFAFFSAPAKAEVFKRLW